MENNGRQTHFCHLTIFLLVLHALVCTPCLLAKSVDDSDWIPGPSKMWYVNWTKALKTAREKKRPLFVLFGDSDKRNHPKFIEILNSSEFEEFARKKVVLFYVDKAKKGKMPKSQRRHNRKFMEALNMYLLDPTSAYIFTTRGEMILGSTWDGYWRDLGKRVYLKKIHETLREENNRIKKFYGPWTEPLFETEFTFDEKDTKPTDGEAEPREKSQTTIARKSLLDGINVEITDMALMDSEELIKTQQGTCGIIPENIPVQKLKFMPPSTKIKVPYGYSVLFRLDYEIPPGLSAQLFTRVDWTPEEHEKRRYYFAANGSRGYTGKGTTFGFIVLTSQGKTYTVTSVKISTKVYDRTRTAELGTISTFPVNLKFLEKGEK